LAFRKAQRSKRPTLSSDQKTGQDWPDFDETLILKILWILSILDLRNLRLRI